MVIFWFRMGLNSKRLGRLSHQFHNYLFSSSGAMISVDHTCNYLIPKKLSLSTTSLLQSCVALQLQPQQFGSVRFFAAPSWVWSFHIPSLLYIFSLFLELLRMNYLCRPRSHKIKMQKWFALMRKSQLSMFVLSLMKVEANRKQTVWLSPSSGL